MKPTPWIYVLHNLQSHSIGFQVLIFSLKDFKFLDSLISFGTIYHVVGPLYLIVSMPEFTFFTLGSTHSCLPRVALEKSS